MSSATRRTTLLASVLILVPWATLASEITLSDTVAFAKGANVPPKVQESCNLQTIVPQAIANASEKVSLVQGRGSMQVEITGIRGPGGGVFSGAKWIEIKGRTGGKSFRARRVSVVDIFSGGTCGILAKCARAIGKDVSVWLESPTDGALLGDAR